MAYTPGGTFGTVTVSDVPFVEPAPAAAFVPKRTVLEVGSNPEP